MYKIPKTKTYVYKVEIDAKNEKEALKRLSKGDFDDSILEEEVEFTHFDENIGEVKIKKRR